MGHYIDMKIVLSGVIASLVSFVLIQTIRSYQNGR